MRVTVIPDDQVVIVDGFAINDIDMSALDSDIHAIQWDNGTGHVEWESRPNTVIEDVSPYQNLLDQWTAKKAIIDAKEADPFYGWTQAEIDAYNAKQQRQDEVEAAKESAGMKELTVDQAQAYITNQLDTTALDATGVDIDNATDLATAKAAFKSSVIELRKLVIAEKEILLKMIPYIL